MFRRVLFAAIVFGTAACSATPASFGITGPGTAAPISFTAPAPDGDASVGVPGIQNSGSPYSNSLRPAGDAARPGDFYGYN
jgi:hypothetical protein